MLIFHNKTGQLGWSHLNGEVAFDQKRRQENGIAFRFEMPGKPDIWDPDIGGHREEGLHEEGRVGQLDFAGPTSELAQLQRLHRDRAGLDAIVAQDPGNQGTCDEQCEAI